MGFNDQNDALGGRGSRKFIFKEGVRFKHMTGQQAILFRLMPAFDPANPNPGTSYVPCLDRNGKLTEWGAYLRMVRFVGHGKGGSTRQDLLSLKTFETANQPTWCPLDALWQTINADMATWGYLIDDGDRKDKNRPRPAYGKITSLMVANILDINATQNGVQLGVFTTGAANKLVDKRDGMVFQPNASPGVEEAIKQNYMYAYANGDITCPNNAPVFVVEKDNDKGEFSSYKITVGVGQDRRVLRRPVDQALMAQRYNLADPGSFLNIPTEEDLIQSLIQLLNMRSPQGYHEHALLKIAFPNHQIPEPPPAPAASSTVAMGYAPQGGFPAPGGYAPQGSGFPMSPGAGIPGSVPPAGYGSGMPGAGVPGAVPPAGYGSSAGIPGAVPPAGYGAPAQGMGAVPPAPGMGVGVPAPGMGVPAPAAEVPAQATAPDMAGVVANATAAGVPIAAGPGPVAPGDPVPGFDSAGFLSKLRGGSAAK